MTTYTARFRSSDQMVLPDLIREFGGVEGTALAFVYSERKIEHAQTDQDAVRKAIEMAKSEHQVLLTVVKTTTLYQA